MVYGPSSNPRQPLSKIKINTQTYGKINTQTLKASNPEEDFVYRAKFTAEHAENFPSVRCANLYRGHSQNDKMAAVLSEHLTCYKYNIHLLISARNSSSYGLVQITSRKETAGRTGSGRLPAVHVQVIAAQTELLQR